MRRHIVFSGNGLSVLFLFGATPAIQAQQATITVPGISISADQGGNRSMVMQAPSLTVMNGGTGMMFSGSIRPFVIGVVPIVGGGVAPVIGNLPPELAYPSTAPRISPVREALDRIDAGLAPPLRLGSAGSTESKRGQVSRPRGRNNARSAASTAEHGDISIAEIRRRQAQEDRSRQREVDALVERAVGAQAAGRFKTAAIYYQMAARRATGEQKQKLLKKLKSTSN